MKIELNAPQLPMKRKREGLNTPPSRANRTAEEAKEQELSLRRTNTDKDARDKPNLTPLTGRLSQHAAEVSSEDTTDSIITDRYRPTDAPSGKKRKLNAYQRQAVEAWDARAHGVSTADSSRYRDAGNPHRMRSSRK